MAYGQVVSIATGTHTQEYVPSGASYPAIAILNPNDGIIFVSNNADCLGTSVGQWDYKIPSQSYAALPGPWLSAGLYYVDQSGSGAAGQITIYPIPSQIPFPQFNAIGRAIQTIGTTLDITESPQPQPPGGGILRLWADTGNNLNVLNSLNVNCEILDTCNYSPLITTLTAGLSVSGGHVQAFTGYLVSGVDPAVGAINGDVVLNRGGASPGSGAAFFGNSGSHYIFFTGTVFSITDGISTAGDVSARYLSSSDGSNGIVSARNGSLYVRSAGSTNSIVMDSGSGGLQVTAGPVSVPNSYITAGAVISATPGDVNANRGNNTGYYWYPGGHYVGWDGSNYGMTSAGLWVGGVIHADANAPNPNSPGALLTFPQAVGQKICLYDNGGGNSYGMGINPSEVYICYSGDVRMRTPNGSGTINFTLDGTGTLTIPGDLHCNGLFASQALTWNGSFSGGSVVGVGGSHVADWLVVVNGTAYRIQLWA